MKNKFSKWDVGGGSRSIIQGLNLFTSRNLFKSLKSILMVVALLSLSSNVWGDDVTLTNAQIVAGTGGTGYGNCSATDSKGNTWNAYAIKNHHSSATSSYKYWQIKKYASSTAYYVQVPEMPGKITQIVMTVSNASQPMTGGGNSATLYFSSSNSTSAAGTGIVSGTGASSVTIDASSLKLKSGYITAGGAVRIWNVTVTYEAGSSTTYYLAGSMNDWSTTADQFTGTPLSVTKNLSANTSYTFKVATNGTWDTSYGKNYTINRQYCTDITLDGSDNVTLQTDKAGDYTFNITINSSGDPVLSVVYPPDTWQLAGFNDWGNKIDFVNGSCQVNLTAKEYATNTNDGFKLIKNGEVYYGNNGTMTRSNCSGWTMESDKNNCGIVADEAGTYTFTINTSGTNPVLTVTYPVASLKSIAEVIAATTSTENTLTVTMNNWVITAVSGNQAYITDGTNAMMLCYYGGTGFSVGDHLSGTVSVKTKIYEDLPEFTTLTSSTTNLTKTSGTATPVAVTDLSVLDADYNGFYITFTAPYIKDADEYEYFQIGDDGDNWISYWDKWGTGATVEVGNEYNVTGIVIIEFDDEGYYSRDVAPLTSSAIQEVIHTYDATFANGGHGTAPAAQSQVSSVTLAAITGVTGWTNDYWTADVAVKDGSNNTIAAGTHLNNATTYKLTANTTFTAHWQVNSHTLTWELDGGSTTSGSSEYTHGTVEYGATITAPADPTKANKKFDGWMQNSVVVTPATTMPDNDLTYVAKWRDIVWTDYLTDCSAPDTWTVWADFDGDENWSDYTITDGVVVVSNVAKESIFDFKIRKTNNNTEYTYYGASGDGNRYTTSDEPWTLDHLNENGYNVHVHAGAAGVYTINVTNMTGDAPQITVTYPTAYTIHFDGKGADYGSMADIVNIASGENVVLPDNDFTKTNNAFVGWDTNSAGTNVVYGNQATINNVSADITLYAVWVSARYTITLDANGGTVSPDKVQQAVVGGTVALPTPTKDGYAFDGWYTEREGGSKITEAYPIPLADATYYAHWTSLETSWYVKGDFDWINGVQFVKMPGQSSDVAFAIVEWNSNDNMNFKIYDLAEDKWYGNEGTMTRTNCTGWNVWSDNGNNTKLTPTGHGHYIFKLDLSGEYPAISVSYPNWNYDSHNSTAGTRGQGNFTYVNPLDWKYEGFILPTINNELDEGKQIWIGDGAWNDNYSDNWWYRWIKLNQYADETVGHGVDGAVGTLHINPFSGSENYGLRFDPAGYGMKYGSGSGVSYMTGGYAFTQKTNDPAVWNTQAIENIEDLQGKQFYVGLATATEGEYKFSYDYVGECNGLSAIANINDIKVWTEANPDRWGDATVGSLSNTRGHFQIWADNASQKNFYIHWIPDNKMTFDLGDAKGHIAAIDPMYRGRDLSGSEATITLPEPADWISHTFDGWVINGVQHDAGDEILLNEDMTAVAQWTTNYYTITYTGISAYSTTCDGSTLVLCGTDQTVCIPIEATGYEFSGWTSDVEIGGKTEFNGGEPFTMPCEDVTFIGSYTPITYNITYAGLEAGEHSNPLTYTVESEFTFAAPNDRAGYEFLGWFDAETDGNQVTGIVLGSTGDTTVWAHWNAKQINVTLKANYTDGTDGSVNFTYGTKTKSAYTAVSNKFGYTLSGYYTTAEGGNKILDANGDIYGTNKSGWIDDEGNWIRTAADSKLYAHWSAIQGIDYYVYHYKMNVDGSYPETPTAQTSGTGHTDEVKTNLDPKTYEGFVTPEHQDLTIVYGGENILRYYYERNKYKLTWEGLEDATVTGDYTQGQVYHGATITYPTSVSKDGFYFKGWDPKPTTMPMAATTIAAQWAAYENYRTYCGNAVTFVANGGTGDDYVVTVDADKLTHIPTVETAGFTREGYGFAGWMVDGDESKTVYAPDATINPITDGMIVNAVWISIPTINEAVPVITSTNNVGIASAQRTLTVANPDGLEATIHIAYKKNGEAVLPTNSEFRFCNTGGNISENNITSSETAIATDFTIQYKPNAYNKIDSDYTLYITVTRKGSEAIVSSAEFNLKGRSLPEKFVIAVKNNSEQWLALPANMTGACTPAGMPITVTGEGLGMTADASVAAAYSLTGHDFAKDSAFFTSVYNSKDLWASKSGSDIDNGGTANSKNKLNYEWGLTPTDETLISYNMANKQNGKELNYYNDSKFGMYASGVNAIYFIAVTPKEETTAVVDEWYKNKILFHLPFAMKSVSMTINGVAVEDDDITIVNRKIKTTGYVLYELGGNIDLVAHSGQVMELTIGDGTTEYVANISIPQIIVAEVASCSALPAKADVVVRDGGHLTIDIAEGAMAKSFNNVTIYPNSKISVPEGKYFNVKSLTFFGGIDEWYDTEESEYVETNIYAPELSLKGTMKADTLIYRMRVNAEHMMPVSFPYNVTINKIVREDKLDSPSWGKVGTDIRLETYNGELRAAGNRKESDESTWTEIKEGTLTAGIGYTVAAQNRFKNYPYTVLDFPMANPYKSVAAEEVAKNAAVQAHDAVNWYDKGWNLMGNPYLAGITGAGAIKVNETDYDFVYIPTADGGDYYQGPIATAKILPFKDFFVQVNEGGTMYFDLTKRVDAPARMLADIERTAQFSIGLAGADKTDITYFKVADNFTESYDIPGDNAKMFGSAVNTKVYSLLNGEDQLAQMALNADMTAQPIQLGYIAPENGEYIFALDNTYTDYQNVEHIYLLENGEIKVDLLNAQYTFTTEAKTEDERFAILIVMKGAKMPTDLMDGLFDNDVASPKKVIYNDHFYILNTNRRVYDGTGKYINKMQKNK